MFSQACVKNSVHSMHVYPSVHWGRNPPAQCILGYTQPWADPPPLMVTAADSMHPTGMHSCGGLLSDKLNYMKTLKPFSRRPTARLPIDVPAT